MNILVRLFPVLVLILAAPVAAAPPQSFIAGETGWFADSAGSGLMALRTTVRPSPSPQGPADLGTMLVFCSPFDDRLIFNLSPAGSIRTVEPSGSGTAHLRSSQGGGLSFTTALRTFAGGSFEIQDLPTGQRNVARSFVAELARGGARFEIRLNGVSDHGRFERERIVRIDFVVTKQSRVVLEYFETSCRLLNRGSGRITPQQAIALSIAQGAIPAK